MNIGISTAISWQITKQTATPSIPQWTPISDRERRQAE